MVDPSKKVPDLNCGVQDLLLEVVDLKQVVPDAGSEIQWDPPNLTPVIISGTVTFITQPDDAEVWSGPKRTVESLSQT